MTSTKRNVGSKSSKHFTDEIEVNVLRQSLIETEAKCVALAQTVDQLLKDSEEKSQTILHLQKLLQGANVPIIGSQFIETEEIIAERQLQFLKEKALTKELNLEETKKFEIYTKIKRNKPSEDNPKEKDVTPDRKSLLALASRPIKNEE